MNETTIYDIAKKAGVSASTVSRVINNYQYVRKDTREKIQKLLDESNYIPNAAARSLVTQSSRMVGVLIADLRTTHHTDGVYFIEQEFSRNGYACLIYNTGADPERQASYIALLSKKNIDALVMMGSVYQNEAVEEAIRTYIPSIPVAICNGYIEGDNIYSIKSDEKNGVAECVKLLSDKGHRRIAFISNHMTPSNIEKVEGFEEGFAQHVAGGEKYVIEAGDSIEDISVATERLLEEHPDVSAIMYSEDYVAMIGMHALVRIGKRIPEDIAVVGINNSRFGEISNPSLTTLDNMLYDTSIIAAKNIIRVFAGETVANRILISTKIIERDSTARE